jgi:hypothetical protein
MSIILHKDKEEEESDTGDEDLPGPEVLLSACGHLGHQGWWLYLWTSRQSMLAP